MPRLSKIGAACLAAFGWTGNAGVSASYLVVAGGGAGGSANASWGGAGGGAGGFLASSISLNPSLSYVVTVGAGGAGYSNSAASNGGSGTNSSVSTITSIGGGGGGNQNSGLSGGSGGGGGNASGTGGTATSGQGFRGGNGNINRGGAGGGGASAQGTDATNNSYNIPSAGFAGGAGTASSISGASVTYAGGGGGGGMGTSGGAGGTGGGGAGGNGSTPAVGGTGTANTGGGGGGGSTNSAGSSFTASGSGGSGIVIISYLAPQQFSGGVVTTSGGNVIHTFTTSGTLGPITTISASYLIVAGGGAGSFNYGGGGGAGGLLSGSALVIDPYSTYVVTVGAGGIGSTGNQGTSGSNSVFSGYATSAVGGGYGGCATVGQNTGASGGSGGGGGGNKTGAAGGAGTSGQGFAGGAAVGAIALNGAAGGGGGSSAVGVTATTGVGGAGGAGTASSISGSSVTYAGGGGGNADGTQGAGGSGGGGAAGNPGTAGTANTGGGGGGSGTSSGNGGSGVVIISYAGATQLMAGGTVTISGGNVIHTFTSSGYLTPITLVNRSLRFRSSASAYLNRTPATASNRTTWSWSGWVKRGKLGAYQTLFSTYGNSTNIDEQIRLYNSDVLNIEYYSTSSFVYQLLTTPVYRDPAAWYHIVVAMDTTQATASNRIKIYVNGTQVTSFSTATYPAQNTNTLVDGALPHYIGVDANNGLNAYYDGYMAEVNFIDGQALAPTAFGTFNSYGVWQPITYGGSYGTNGFYLPFTNTTSATTLAYDFSPQGNNWTPNNISVSAGSTYDSMTDVPTLTSATAANYCVMNPIFKAASQPTFSNANLTVSPVAATYNASISTFNVTSGKWYVEILTTGTPNTGESIGIASLADLTTYVNTATYIGSSATSYGFQPGTGNKTNNATGTAYGSATVSGNIVMIAFDLDNGKIWWGKNGTWFASGDPAAGTNAAFTGITGSNGYSVATVNYSGGLTSMSHNFGQQPFTYTAPSGFVALNTYNL